MLYLLKSWHFTRKPPLIKNLKDSFQLFVEIANDTGIYLRKKDDLELIFSLEEEPTEDNLF